MPWKESTTMDLRREFVTLALSSTIALSELCHRFGISRKTGYKWLERYCRSGPSGLCDLSRRPLQSPYQTSTMIEDMIVSVRSKHPAWGPRKIVQSLTNDGVADLPSLSTVSAILRRRGCPGAGSGREHRDFQRFEAAAPNMLWQMDFKGHFQIAQGRCYPLTILDDHSRFSPAIEACSNQKIATVQEKVQAVFRHYGMPLAMIADNGAPWGSSGYDRYSDFDIWLMERDVRVMHSRIFHPQTCGKIERFHRSLKAEVLAQRILGSLEQCQSAFDDWRYLYNTKRPHDALDLAVPASRYTPSPRPYQEHPPALEYASDDHVRVVNDHGDLSFKGKHYRIGKSFARRKVALRVTEVDGALHVVFARQNIAVLNLRTHEIELLRHQTTTEHRGSNL